MKRKRRQFPDPAMPVDSKMFALDQKRFGYPQQNKCGEPCHLLVLRDHQVQQPTKYITKYNNNNKKSVPTTC